MIISGIYKITCLSNQKYYIGSAVNCNRRFNEHRNRLQKNKHSNIYLQYAWNKYGSEMFVFEILEVCNKENLLSIEQKYLNTFFDQGNVCMNLCPNAQNKLGTKQSSQTKQKISVAHQGKNVSSETRKKLSAAAKKQTNKHFKLGKNNIMYGRSGELHPNKVSVASYDLKTGLICKSYPTYKAAAIDMTGNPNAYANIAAVCAKRRKSAFGFFWKLI